MNFYTDREAIDLCSRYADEFSKLFRGNDMKRVNLNLAVRFGLLAVHCKHTDDPDGAERNLRSSKTHLSYYYEGG